MQTTSASYSQLHPSSPTPANLHHHSRRRQNVRRQPNLTMPLRDLTLRRIYANPYHFRFNNHPTEPFCVTSHRTSVDRLAMAEDDSKKKDFVQEKADPSALNAGQGKEEKDEAPEKSTPAVPPPPPEKPLPGDCCGSGCVRCVWDVYYEELEEYNRLYKADAKIS